jgi:hypothetical protein
MAYYILDEYNNPIKSTGTDVGKWLENNPEKKGVKQEHIDNIFISTVFLGLDHSFPWNEDKRPVLWETMIFGGEHDQYQERYSSYEDALKGHQTAIDLIKKENGKK